VCAALQSVRRRVRSWIELCAPRLDTPFRACMYARDEATGCLLAQMLGATERSQRRFVEFFRRASPYVESHRGSTFVIILPGLVMENQARLESLFKVSARENQATSCHERHGRAFGCPSERCS